MHRSFPLIAPIVRGGLIAATLDILMVFVFWGVVSGTSPARILQSVASGLLGSEAFQGGWPVAAFGLSLHLGIALVMATVYVLAAARLPALHRRFVLFGALYGLLLFGVMNGVVVPLSNAGPPPALPAWWVANLLSHVFLVGVPMAWAAHRHWRGP